MLRIDRDAPTDGIAVRVEALPGGVRLLLAALFGAGGVACLVGGRLLALTDDWVARAVALVLFEPAGVLAILAAAIAARPRSLLSRYVSSALARRAYGSAAFVIVALAAILELARWGARELLRSRLG